MAIGDVSGDGSITVAAHTVSAAGLAGGLFFPGTLTLPKWASTDLATGENWDTFSDGYVLLGPDLYPRYFARVDAIGITGKLVHGDSFFPELTTDGGSLESPLAWGGQWALAGVGLAGGVGHGDAVVGALAVGGAIDDPKLLPAWAVAATGTAAALITGTAAFPAWSGAGSLAPPLALPALSVAGTLSAGTLAAGVITLPALLAAARVGTAAEVTLPELAVAARGFVGNRLAGAAALPRVQVAATHKQDTRAHADVTLQVLTVAAHGTPGHRIDAAVTFSRLHLNAVAAAGRTATATATVSLLRVNASGYANPIGTAYVELPMLQLDGRASGPTVLPSLTIAVNTQLAAVSEYQALAANSFARFGGVTLAATASGIVALIGDSDLGVPISAEVVAGISDYGSDQFKRIIAGYVGYRATGDIELTLISDDQDEHVYRLAPRHWGRELHATRVKFGRGADGRYWQWKLANLAGADFAVDTIGLDIVPLSKKIG